MNKVGLIGVVGQEISTKGILQPQDLQKIMWGESCSILEAALQLTGRQAGEPRHIRDFLNLTNIFQDFGGNRIIRDEPNIYKLCGETG